MSARKDAPALRFLVTFIGLVSACGVPAQSPEWIWRPVKGRAITNGEVCHLRQTFTVDATPNKAVLSVAADDDATVYLNGREVLHVAGFAKASHVSVMKEIEEGVNVIAIRATNGVGEAGVVASLELSIGKRKMQHVVTGTNWLTSSSEVKDWQKLSFQPTNWLAAHSFGAVGVKPWGNLEMRLQPATPASELTTLPGFKVELLRSAQPGEGSWVGMTVDSKGRLILSPQERDYGLFRATLSRSGQVQKFEQITTNVGAAMGMLWAFDSLYVSGIGAQGQGLYRLRETKRGRFDDVTFLKKFDGSGEHGPHAIVLGPDKMLYIMNGNHTKPPAGISTNSPHRNYQEDFLLARQWDPGGHAVGILAPGGYVVRTDREGKKWDLLLGGFRNCYDFDFNADGEMFTFDSDMEWDWGLPWYRPTRILHCVIGGEYGWRSGTANWPEYYADSLPPTVNIGIGSPTGVKFGTKSSFPQKYREALYAFDWSYGRIFAVHLQPRGATYTADAEVFLKGKPLNLTDLEFGRDGAMYFTTGGRATQAGLYRVSFVGKKPPTTKSSPAEKQTAKEATAARKLRHKLEAFHGKEDPRAVDFAWPYLNSEDWFIRHAARIAIEWQPVAGWKDRALAETSTNAGLTALLALARCGGKEPQPDLLLALKKFPFDSLSVTQKLAKLRVIELSFIRQGKPDSDLAKLAMEKLNRQYPTTNEFLNRELSELLIYLEAPEVVAKTMALLDRAPTQEEQAHYIFYLRKLLDGWTLEQRRHYFEWFKFAQEQTKQEVTYPQGSPYNVWSNQKKAAERHPPELLRWFKEAGRDYGDGASYPKYLVAIRKDAVGALTEGERAALADLTGDETALSAFKLTRERHFVREWKMEDFDAALGEVSRGRNFESGKAAFNDAQCTLCHRFGNEGGSVGPELTAAASKYSRHDILESILNPSKVVSDQFQNVTVIKKDGEDVTGRVVDENDQKIVIQPTLLAPSRSEIKKGDVAERRASLVSPMPEGLLDALTQEEILDVLAYIESAGKKSHADFQSQAAKP